MVKRYLIFSISSTDFAFFFQIFFLRLRLTTGLESRKKAYKKEKFFKPVKELSQALLQLGMSATGMQFLDEYRMDFLRFRIIVEKIDELNNEDLEEEAQFSLNFVTNLILKWQEEQILQEI